MKKIIYLMGILLAANVAMGQDVTLSELEYQLEIRPVKSNGEQGLHELVIDVSTSKIKSAGRMYIRVQDENSKEFVFATVLTKEDLKGNPENEQIRDFTSREGELSLAVGAFPNGSYLVYVRIEESRNIRFEGSQKITIEQ